MNNFIFLKDNQVYVSYTNLWTNKGHNWGHGLISPDNQHFFIQIPKCASTFTENYLKGLGWKIMSLSNYLRLHDFPIDNQVNKIIIPLRNPINRWLSGLLTYFPVYHSQWNGFCKGLQTYKNIEQNLVMSLIFDVITFDDHTERQCMFLLGIDNLQKCTYLNVDENYTSNLDSLLVELGLYTSNEKPPKNSVHSLIELSNEHRSLKYFTSRIQEEIDSNTKFRDKLHDWFSCDFQLIDQTKFYGG